MSRPRVLTVSVCLLLAAATDLHAQTAQAPPDRQTLQGAVYGGLVGAFAGALAGFWFCSQTAPCESYQPVAVAASLGAMVGAPLGIRAANRAAFSSAATPVYSLRAEVVAARDLLSAYPRQQVLLASNYAVPDQAPPATTDERIPTATVDFILGALDRPVGTGGLIVRFSKPRIEGTTATLTVTVDFPDERQPGRRGYETVRYVLERQGTTWTIRERTQLGIS